MQTYEQGQVCYLTGEHGEAVKHVYLGSRWVPMSAEMESVIKILDDRYSARDAEWQARVDRATDEAVSQALKVVQASEDYRKLQARVEKLEAALDYAIACLPDAPLNAKEKLRAALGREWCAVLSQRSQGRWGDDICPDSGWTEATSSL